jgi:hypothetical protein
MFHTDKDTRYKFGTLDLGLHFLFVSVLVQVLFSSSGGVGYLSAFLVIIATLLLLWGALHGMRKRWTGIHIPNSVRMGAAVMVLAVMVILLAAMQYHGTIYGKAEAFIPYLWALVALGGVDEKEWFRVKKAFRIHALVGTVVFIGVLMTQGASVNYVSRFSFIGDSGEASPFLDCRQLMYSYPILLILLPEEKWFWRFVGVAVTLGMIIWVILGQFRSTLVLGVGLAIVFSLFSWQRARAVRWAGRLAVGLAVVVCVAVGWFLLRQGSLIDADVIVTAWSQVGERFTDSNDAESGIGLENIRYVEANSYLKNLTFDRVLFGDHGEWVSPFGHVMHVGYFRYIIYGGLPTLLAIWLLLYWQGWRGILASRKLSVLAPASVAAMHTIQAIPVGMLFTVPQVAMLFLCAGYCWHRMAVERAMHEKRRG